MNFFNNIPNFGSPMIPQEFPQNNPMLNNNLNYKINELETRIKKLELRISQLETDKFNTYNDPDTGMYMI